MWDVAWTFKTKHFKVELHRKIDFDYVYDGDDADGETQKKLDSGEYIAFDSRVVVYFEGVEVGQDNLGGSVYAVSDADEFFTAHRDRNPENRNCSIKSNNYIICHYFPDMVRQAINEARENTAHMKLLYKNLYIRNGD